MSQNMAKRARIDKNLTEQVQCPVCMEVPRAGPIYSCPNGHLVCQMCKGGTCPICREAMGEHRSLLAVAVIENILHGCKFEGEGCEEVFKLENLSEHEKVCKHRSVSCPYGQCDQKIALFKLLDHLSSAPHTCSIPGDVLLNGKAKKAQTFTMNIEGLKNNWFWRVLVGSRGDVKFAICVKKCGDYFLINMVMFESEEECIKYNIEMEVYKCGSDPASRHSFKFRGNPTSIDKSKTEIGNLGLSIHREAMEKMVIENGRFSFSVSFSFL